MKKYIYILLIPLILICISACSNRKVIPDKQLTQIFKEFYLTNALLNNNVAYRTDSLNMYEPILRRHGYTIQDLENTVQDFSRRKSARLSDVVERAIEQLQDESDYYNSRVAVYDTINERAARMFRTTVFTDSLIYVDRLRDTSKLKLDLRVKEGTYRISYNYKIDTLDKNNNYRTTFNLYDTLGRKNTPSTHWMNKRGRQKYWTSFAVSDKDTSLQIIFGNYNERSERPYITIDSLVVQYDLPQKQSLDSISRIFYNFLPREMFYDQQQDEKTDITLPTDAEDTDS